MENKENEKLVSIGLPIYNRPQFLGRILDILINQTYKNLEIIISDNASTKPDVFKIVHEYMARDPRISFFVRDKNYGVLENANYVLKKARGEYFAWISDDDWRSEDFIEVLVNELEDNPDAKFAFCNYREVDSEGGSIDFYPDSHLELFASFCTKNRLIRSARFYFQDASKGKANFFYSVFRREFVQSLRLDELSQNYSKLNMDCMISFVSMQESYPIINPKTMCKLTCGNIKYYDIDRLKIKNKSVLKKLGELFITHNNEKQQYLENSKSVTLKIIIKFLFIPKFFYLVLGLFWIRLKSV